MEGLPVDCLSEILSLTSPREVCRLSTVSSSFRSAAESDAVWRKFLPYAADDLVRRLADALAFPSSNKEVFVRLCRRPLIFDTGRKSFGLERSTGSIVYMLSARELSITWGDDPMYWSWKSVPESRFAEAVELRFISWLEIEARVSTESLSPHTLYRAYLVLSITKRAHGLDSVPAITWVEVAGTRVSRGKALIQNGCGSEGRGGGDEGGGWSVPVGRDGDGWKEIELGEFVTGAGGGDGVEVRAGLKEVEGCQVKGGIVVEGIELRPKIL
ncbi:hypothetical protein MLD38_017821 [Melastoma candidum]|uniref:Uncharacterized protein n=1 Tax=Melastoma candidum TaxID=119954 RepID=A0ACB9QVZ0_9MYRT|nr:hypothetical protein MLD38_017821 [Melastoma candidum]